ncbi:MAG: sigma-70 family RNA polymerase sigma factor [Ignavibacteriales bacterium]|nr:MAG: sigma-70 family RNA polymerase sigma factor [Ignavibacteriales bacterium]
MKENNKEGVGNEYELPASYNSSDEEVIIDQAKKGNKKALTQLVKNYEQTVYNFSFKICRDRDKAENIMQETFYSMVKHLNQFDSKSKLSTWLYRIVANHCLMQARKEKNRQFVSIDNDESLYEEKYAVDYSRLPSKYTENEELKKILDTAISKLSPDYRMIFLLRDVEGLSTEETAEAAGITIPAVKSRLHRARAFLRNELTEAFQQ